MISAWVIGVAALVAFVFAERRHAAPMLPPRLFRQGDFTGANVLTLLLYAALGGGLFYVPLHLIQVQGLSATAAGAALLPFVAILFFLSRWAGGLVDRHGARKPLIVGPLIAGAGFALLLLPGAQASYWRDFLPGIAVLGLGMAIAIAPLTTAVMNAVGPADAGTASGVNNAMSRVAGLLAIAVFAWVMALVFEPALLRGLRSGALPPPLLDAVWEQRARLAAIEVPQGASGPAAELVREAVRSAFVAGYRWIMVLSVALALASAGVAALWVGREPVTRAS